MICKDSPVFVPLISTGLSSIFDNPVEKDMPWHKGDGIGGISAGFANSRANPLHLSTLEDKGAGFMVTFFGLWQRCLFFRKRLGVGGT